MNQSLIALALISLTLSGGAAAQTQPPSASATFTTLTGTVSYRQRIALLPGAHLRVRLEDASHPGAAGLVAEVTLPTGGRQVPLSFALPYRSGDLAVGRRYQIRATLFSGSRLLFTAVHPFSSEAAPSEVNIVLQAVASQGRPNTLSLTDTYWKLTTLAGRPALSGMGRREAHLRLQADEKRYSGSAGCNQISGTYTLNGNRLRFGPGIATKMACPEPLMKQEEAFLSALKTATTYRITGDTLELSTGSKIVASFVSQPIRHAPTPPRESGSVRAVQ